jgi:hypothetical protein
MVIATESGHMPHGDIRQRVNLDLARTQKLGPINLLRENDVDYTKLTVDQRKSLADLEDALTTLWKGCNGDRDTYWKAARKVKEEVSAMYDSPEWGRVVERTYTIMVKEWIGSLDNARVGKFMEEVQTKIEAGEDDEEDDDDEPARYPAED